MRRGESGNTSAGRLLQSLLVLWVIVTILFLFISIGSRQSTSQPTLTPHLPKNRTDGIDGTLWVG